MLSPWILSKKKKESLVREAMTQRAKKMLSMIGIRIVGELLTAAETLDLVIVVEAGVEAVIKILKGFIENFQNVPYLGLDLDTSALEATHLIPNVESSILLVETPERPVIWTRYFQVSRYLFDILSFASALIPSAARTKRMRTRPSKRNSVESKMKKSAAKSNDWKNLR